MKSAFSKELNRCLLEKYGRLPSAAAFARDFNFRSPHLSPVSAETARRWVRGLSMPEFERLGILMEWLEMELDFKAQNKGNSGAFEPTHQQLTSQEGSASRARESALRPDELQMVTHYRRADGSTRRLILAAVLAMSKTAPRG